MWFKTKQEEKQPFKPTQTIVHRRVSVQTNRTIVEVKLQDGRNFKTAIYGEAYQNVDGGIVHTLKGWAQVRDPSVSPISIISSVSLAREFVSRVSPNVVTLVDDPKEITESVVGSVISANILDSEEYGIMFDEAYLEEIKDV